MKKIARRRRRMLLLDGLCIAVILAGLLLRDGFRMLGIVLTLGGIVCLLALGLLTARAFCSRCPHCGCPVPTRAVSGPWPGPSSRPTTPPAIAGLARYMESIVLAVAGL